MPYSSTPLVHQNQFVSGQHMARGLQPSFNHAQAGSQMVNPTVPTQFTDRRTSGQSMQHGMHQFPIHSTEPTSMQHVNEHSANHMNVPSNGPGIRTNESFLADLGENRTPVSPFASYGGENPSYAEAFAAHVGNDLTKNFPLDIT